jgi:hypothetical protein
MALGTNFLGILSKLVQISPSVRPNMVIEKRYLIVVDLNVNQRPMASRI